MVKKFNFVWSGTNLETEKLNIFSKLITSSDSISPNVYVELLIVTYSLVVVNSTKQPEAVSVPTFLSSISTSTVEL